MRRLMHLPRWVVAIVNSLCFCLGVLFGHLESDTVWQVADAVVFTVVMVVLLSVRGER